MTQATDPQTEPSRARSASTISRRTLLRSALGGSVVAVAGCAAGPFSDRTARDTPGTGDLLDRDALSQAASVRAGEVTPRELLQATIDRIEARNGPINAVVTTFYERALDEADGTLPDGPFRGVPFLLKDLNDLEGTPKSMGSRLFDGYVSEESSPHTQAALEGGFVILGKTNTPEFGLVATTESAALGVCRNPWNLEHSAGGSSGGAAAAVAAGMTPIAQASDGGGSIRIPASCNGVFGLKPSRGRNRSAPQTRAVDISVKHSVSRSVRDTAAYSVVLQRRDADAPFEPMSYVEGPAKRRLRIGFHTHNMLGAAPDPDVANAVDATARLCSELGHEVVPVVIDFDGEAFAEHFVNLWASIPAGIVEIAKKRGLDPAAVLEPVTLGLAERFAQAGPDVVPRAKTFLDGFSRRLDANFEKFDVLLSPVLGRAPVRLGKMAGTLPFDEVWEPMLDYVSYTPMYNASGHPAMSVPLAWNGDGLPIGSHFAAGYGQEATLLALAYELEAARPWADKRPPDPS